MSEFIEYPKWLHPEGEKPVLVANAQEEADFMASISPKEAPKKRGRKNDAERPDTAGSKAS